MTREEFFSYKGPAKGHSTCKGPEVGNSLHIWGTRRRTSVAGGWWVVEWVGDEMSRPHLVGSYGQGKYGLYTWNTGYNGKPPGNFKQRSCRVWFIFWTFCLLCGGWKQRDLLRGMMVSGREGASTTVVNWNSEKWRDSGCILEVEPMDWKCGEGKGTMEDYLRNLEGSVVSWDWKDLGWGLEIRSSVLDSLGLRCLLGMSGRHWALTSTTWGGGGRSLARRRCLQL